MKLLLDENLPKKLKLDFTEYEIYTTFEKGWAGISNGNLLKLLLENEFDALLTFDKNLQFQQNFSKYPIKVIVINASDNSYLTLKNYINKIKVVLNTNFNVGPVVIS
ncbi:MAG: hypothetical protein SFY32_09950 [Bacteroidota bacterium]|nr:hypothetical protein [Bacteroidota bacterium]